MAVVLKGAAVADVTDALPVLVVPDELVVDDTDPDPDPEPEEEDPERDVPEVNPPPPGIAVLDEPTVRVAVG